MSSFSVLICTYNRPQLFGQCIRALVEGTSEKPDEIVVVNGGDERTDAIVREYTTHSIVCMKLIKTSNKNLAASRNVGLPHCTGDIIAMTDDDAEVFPDWVSQMKRLHHEHLHAGAIGGAIIGAEQHSLLGRIADQVTFQSPKVAGEVRTLPGVNVSYKREVVERVGAQDETLFRGEDVDYNWRVEQQGYCIWYDPAVRVYHHHRPTLRAFLNQHYMYGRAYYLVRRKWPQMYCVYPHRLQRLKDWLKLVNFLLAAMYEPLLALRRMDLKVDALLAYPLMLMCQVVWRWGMIRQKWVRG